MAAKKTVENKETSLDFEDKNGKRKMTYFDLIKMCLDNPPQGGFSRDDIKKRNRIEEKIKGEVAELEHDEFHSLKKICSDMKWRVRSSEIENFFDYLDDVK